MTRHADAVRAYLDDVIQKGRTPGLQYLVVAPDRTVCEYAAGVADIANGRLMTSATTLMAYSMSKTITAAVVLALVDAGALRLDDPIDRFLDRQPYGPAITVRQLLTHTAGVPNPIPLRWVHAADAHTSFNEAGALEAVLRRHSKAASPPGDKYRYSNIGYWLLGPVVERASGEAFTTCVADRVFRPLGISPSDLSYSVPDSGMHARGYLEKYSVFNLFKRLLIDRALIGSYEGRWLHINDHYVNGPAFGGLVGTARGFARILQDQLAPRSALFGETARRTFYTAERTHGGGRIAMTPGWHVGAASGTTFFYKEGGGGGFHCMMRLYPAAKLTTVMMANATGFDVRSALDVCDPHFAGVVRQSA